MSAVSYGGWLAAAIAGPPLWMLVQSGDLEWTDALLRGAVVAAGCTAGVIYLQRLATGYAAEQRRRHKREVHEAALQVLEQAAVIAAKQSRHPSGAANPPGAAPRGR